MHVLALETCLFHFHASLPALPIAFQANESSPHSGSYLVPLPLIPRKFTNAIHTF